MFFFIKPTLYLFAWIVKCNFLLDVCYVSSKITCVRLHGTHFVFRLFVQKFPFTKMTDFQLHKLFCNNCRSQSIRKKILIHARILIKFPHKKNIHSKSKMDEFNAANDTLQWVMTETAIDDTCETNTHLLHGTYGFVIFQSQRCVYWL